MGLFIDIIHYNILHSHSCYCYDLFCNYKSKKVNYLKLIWVYSPTSNWKNWHSKQLKKFAPLYVLRSLWRDLSVWEGKLNEALCLWSCLWNLAVLCYDFQCRVHAISMLRNNLGTQICKFKSAMFACNVCVLELVCSWPDNVHCEGLCIAIIFMSGSYT